MNFYNDMYDFELYGWPGEYVYGDDIYVDDYYIEERWKPISECPTYWVSDRARVYNTKTKSFIKPKPMDSHGHLGVCLCSNGRLYYRYIHRLVAEAFIPNPNNFPIVRHLYDQPEYNEIEDLAWGTQKDNMRDCIENGRVHYVTDEEREKGLQSLRTPIKATNLSTGEEAVYGGQGIASKILHIPQANIWKVLNGERMSAGGYHFEYIKEDI